MPFSSCLQPFSTSGSFLRSQFFASGSQSIGVSASASVLPSPSNECSGLISFRIDWFDLAVQGTLKSLLQHHSSKASILRHSTFFMVYFFLVRNAIPLLNLIWAFHHLFFHILGTSKYGNYLDCPDLSEAPLWASGHPLVA